MTEKHPVEIRREELYRLVWETPMNRRAVQYGITGNGLAKICRRLDVPYPPRGYWAKKAAGKKVISFRLPSPKQDTPLTVTIIPTPATTVPDLPAEVRAKAETARSAASVEVSERLLRPHPIIAQWLADHARRKREARAERDPWQRNLIKPGEFSDVDRRQHRILDALFKTLEEQGGKVKQGGRNGLFAEVQGEPIEIQLREKLKQVRRPLNDSEKRWRLPGDKDWRQELQPTAVLVFSIKTYLPDGLRKDWTETERMPMESLLPDIVATLVAAGPLLARQRQEQQEAARQRQIDEQKRYEERRRQKQEENRWRRFVELAQQRSETELARSFLQAIKEMEIDLQQEVSGKTLDGWIAWAEQHAVDADPLTHGADTIFRTITAVTDWSYRE